MFEALIVSLREGVEAALMVGIIAAFLKREGYERFLGAVWAGIGAAVVASLAGAVALNRLAVNEEAFEGVLYLASAVIVGTLLVWMWRHSHAVAGEMKGSLARILARGSGRSIALGLFLFTFFMVVREGIETVLFLAALSLSTTGLMAGLGVVLGLGGAIAFGVLFVRGSLRIDLGRFFKITGIALLIFVVQLLINGYHELSEAGWLPATPTTMATVGPLVKNEVFFVLAVVLLPLLLLVVPSRGQQVSQGGADATGAAGRLARAQAQRQALARLVGGGLGIAILATLAVGMVYARPPAQLSPATAVTPGADKTVRIPLSTFQGTVLHRFQVELSGRAVRFIAIPIEPVDKGGEIATAFDTCLICGPRGYYQEGTAVTCLHCGSAIYPPTIGQPGGCNPVPLASKVLGGDLVLQVADLEAGASLFTSGSLAHGAHAGH